MNYLLIIYYNNKVNEHINLSYDKLIAELCSYIRLDYEVDEYTNEYLLKKYVIEFTVQYDIRVYEIDDSLVNKLNVSLLIKSLYNNLNKF